MDVLTLFIHLGYLGYDAETKEAFIPNREIAGEFENAMSTGGWKEVMGILKASEKLLSHTSWRRDERRHRTLPVNRLPPPPRRCS